MSCNRISGALNAIIGGLLSALLLMQVAMASVPMPAGPGTQFSMVICSAEGVRTVTLSGEDLGDPPAESGAHGKCTLCIQVFDLPACAPEWQAAGRIETTQHTALTAVAQTHGQITSRTDAIRAPPASA